MSLATLIIKREGVPPSYIETFGATAPSTTATEDTIRFQFPIRDTNRFSTVRMRTSPMDDCGVEIVISLSAIKALCGWSPRELDSHHLTPGPRQTACDIYTCGLAGELAQTYLSAKTFELLCLTAQAAKDDQLIPVDHGGWLSMLETERIIAARQLIYERWAEPWTLDKLARANGVNRSKLCRGFRALFGVTVTEALRTCRLERARLDLQSTDQSVAAVAFNNGYTNSASFTRAFKREFGRTPGEAPLTFIIERLEARVAPVRAA